MKSKSTICQYQAVREMMALLSLLVVSATQVCLYAQAPAYVGLDALQLDQLVAPIALDPDSLVAQILTASTYPHQVSDADTWLHQNMNLPPDQLAEAANKMPWNPAVKGLIEFPAVLDSLAKNNAWTAQLGNAYYNQPGDVMNAIQAMRLQAQQSKVLVTTAQRRVIVEAGLIEIVPVNPDVVCVPYYDPWTVWGPAAYPGFVVQPPPAGIVWVDGIAFDPGVAIGVYTGFGWGFDAWAPVWRRGTVVFGGNTYVSNSVTVVNHGNFGAHDSGAFEHGGRGIPGGFHPAAYAGSARATAARATAAAAAAFRHAHPGAGRAYGGRSGVSSHGGASNSAGKHATAGSGRRSEGKNGAGQSVTPPRAPENDDQKRK